MLTGLRVGWRGLRHLQNRGYLYVWANVFWAVLTVLVITAPAAWAGLARMSYLLHRQPSASLDDFWEGFRQNFRRTIPLALFNALFLVITISNWISYANRDGVGFALLRSIWVISLIVVFALQFFGWCFFFAMKQPSLLGAARNAGVMMIQSPLFTLGILLVAAILMIVSVFLPAAWFLLTGGALAAIANSAVLDRLRAAGIEKAPTFAEDEVVDASFTDV
ncbi:MAG: DUF624 domain-containing protein [Anaerolineae bacterium]|nr:DUF624 domain-containing protein [Anaerolineae bacterium]